MPPFAACIGGAFIAAFLYRRNIASVKEGEKNFWLCFFTLGIVLSGIYFSLEVFHFYMEWGLPLFGDLFPVGEAQALTIAVIWHLELIILTWHGLKHNFIPARIIGLLSFGAGLWLLFGPGSEAYTHSGHTFLPVVNPRSVPYLFGVFSAWLAAKKYLNGQNLHILEAHLPVGFAIIANLAALSYLSLEVVGFYNGWSDKLGLGTSVDSAIQMTLSVVWTVYAITLVTAGFILKSKPARLLSIGIFGVTVFKVFLFDLANLETIYRIVSFIVLGGLLVVVSYLYQRYRHCISGQLSSQHKEEA